jgi:membrane protease YdiL (CAAX protease family)
VFSNLILFSPFLIVYLLLNYAGRQQAENPKLSFLIIRVIYTIIFISFLVTALFSLVTFTQQFTLDSKEALEFAGLAIVSMAALLIFIPKVRRKISRSIHINPENPVHVVSLSLSFLVYVQFVLTAFSLEEISKTTVSGTSMLELWSQDILLALVSFVGVGWLQNRSTNETLARLGLVRLKISTVIIGIGFAILFVMINLVLIYIANVAGFGIDPNVEKITNQLLGPLFQTIPGILTIGLAAALGEELIFRGAMLPRFGLLYTSLLFTLVHSNYGLSVATLIVFVLAISLGILRKKYSTTLTMVTHASYNIILGLLTMLGSYIK